MSLHNFTRLLILLLPSLLFSNLSSPSSSAAASIIDSNNNNYGDRNDVGSDHNRPTSYFLQSTTQNDDAIDVSPAAETVSPSSTKITPTAGAYYYADPTTGIPQTTSPYGPVFDAEGFTTFNGNDEIRLIERLMKNYRGLGLARPVYDTKRPMDVHFRLIVEEFSELDEELGVVRIVGTVTALWRDQFLRWNSSMFNGIDALVLRDQQIFMPVITPVGSGSHKAPIFHQNPSIATSTMVWTDNTGLVHASVTESFESSCKIDLANFPLDTQHCNFVFKVLQFRKPRMKLRLWQGKVNPMPLSLTTTTNRSNNNPRVAAVDVDAATIDAADVIEGISHRTNNRMWEVVGVEGAESNITTASGMTFSTIVYTISIQRKADYYLWNILLPTASMAAVQTSVFFLPFSTERVMFSITAVLAVDIFQSSITNKIHSSAEPVPLVKYSTAQLVMGIIITIESILVLSLSRNTDPLPRRVANAVNYVWGTFNGKRKQRSRRSSSLSNNKQVKRCCSCLTKFLSRKESKEGATTTGNNNNNETNNNENIEEDLDDEYYGKYSKRNHRNPSINLLGKMPEHLMLHREYNLQRNVINNLNNNNNINDADIDATLGQQANRCGRNSAAVQSAIYIDIAEERCRLALILDRFFLCIIIIFFAVLPIIFFKFDA